MSRFPILFLLGSLFCALLVVQPALATEYVIRVDTASDNIGNDDFANGGNCSHAILKLKLFGTNGEKKEFSFFGSNQSLDVYWNRSSLASVITPYCVDGAGKVLQGVALTTADRNGFWASSQYYFNVKCQDLETIWKVRACVEDNSASQCKFVKIKRIYIYKGHRMGAASLRFEYPDSNNQKIERKGSEFTITNYSEGDLTSHPDSDFPTYGKNSRYWGELVKVDNLGQGVTISMAYTFRSEQTKADASSDEIKETFGVSTELTGDYAGLGANLKANYEDQATKNIRSEINSVQANSMNVTYNIGPKSYFLILGRYIPKSSNQSKQVSFLYYDNQTNKPVYGSEIVNWTARNDYYNVIENTPWTLSRDHIPYQDEVIAFLSQSCANIEELSAGFPERPVSGKKNAAIPYNPPVHR